MEDSEESYENNVSNHIINIFLSTILGGTAGFLMCMATTATPRIWIKTIKICAVIGLCGGLLEAVFGFAHKPTYLRLCDLIRDIEVPRTEVYYDYELRMSLTLKPNGYRYTPQHTLVPKIRYLPEDEVF